MGPCCGEASSEFGVHGRNETIIQKGARVSKIIKVVKSDGRK